MNRDSCMHTLRGNQQYGSCNQKQLWICHCCQSSYWLLYCFFSPQRTQQKMIPRCFNNVKVTDSGLCKRYCLSEFSESCSCVFVMFCCKKRFDYSFKRVYCCVTVWLELTAVGETFSLSSSVVRSINVIKKSSTEVWHFIEEWVKADGQAPHRKQKNSYIFISNLRPKPYNWALQWI